MVKTRSTKNSGGESTAESEIQTEYSDDFDESEEELLVRAETTVVKKPTKSQSTPVLSTSRRTRELSYRSPVNSDTERIEVISPMRPDVTESPRPKSAENSGLLEGITSIVRNMMTDVVQVMKGMTDTIVASIQGRNVPSTNKSSNNMRESPGGRHSKSKSVTRRRSRRVKRTHNPSPFRSSSSSSSESHHDVSSSENDESTLPTKGKQQNNRLPIFTGKEKWKVWHRRFEAVANLYNWSKKEKIG